MTPPALASRLLDPATHGFFTREGGVSTGHFASLNCSLSSADQPDRVAANRARVASRIGLAPASLLGITQVHGVEVATVDRAWQAGRGPRADAMVTRVAGLGLGVITADCAPVLFQDAASRVIGAAHAGWRGAASGVLEATLEAMLALGATRTGIAAAIGPCIARASYEVGLDMRGETTALDPAAEAFFTPGRDAAHFQFDLAGYCAARLSSAGLLAVDVLGVDTCADERRFFSHRRRTHAGGHPLGHQVSAIRL